MKLAHITQTSSRKILNLNKYVNHNYKLLTSFIVGSPTMPFFVKEHIAIQIYLQSGVSLLKYIYLCITICNILLFC